MNSSVTLRGERILAEKIADDMWELWKTTRSIAHPVKSGKITPEKYWILRLLYNSGEQRVKDIAEKIGTTSSPVTISVKKLESENLVRRTRGESDARVVTVALTLSGRRQFERWRHERTDVLASLLDSLSSDEKRSLQRLLDKVVHGRENVQAP